MVMITTKIQVVYLYPRKIFAYEKFEWASESNDQKGWVRKIAILAIIEKDGSLKRNRALYFKTSKDACMTSNPIAFFKTLNFSLYKMIIWKR